MLEAIAEANSNHQLSYGDDTYTIELQRVACELFGEVDIYPVFNGTGANITALASAVYSFNSIICAETAHINVDECGAPEKLTGAKVISIPTPDGKLTVELIKPHLTNFGECHHSQPKIITISQTTELGTLYTLGEIAAIAELAHSYDIYLHVDGARIANGIAALGCTPKEFAATGLDILSLGGTKNGLMIGEAVVFFNKSLSPNFKYIRKQSMQLYSKMRFISAQLIAYLSDGLWLENAANANRQAEYLYEKLAKIKGVTLTQQRYANAIFLILPPEKKEVIRARYFFYDWDNNSGEVRCMCSFDTTKEDVDKLVSFIEETLNN